MDILFWGTWILIILTAIFAGTFASLANYWKEKVVSVWIVTTIYTFQFFLWGFFVLCILAIAQIIPDLIKTQS